MNNFLVWKNEDPSYYCIGYEISKIEKLHLMCIIYEDDFCDLVGSDVFIYVRIHLLDHKTAPINIVFGKGWT